MKEFTQTRESNEIRFNDGGQNLAIKSYYQNLLEKYVTESSDKTKLPKEAGNIENIDFYLFEKLIPELQNSRGEQKVDVINFWINTAIEAIKIGIELSMPHMDKSSLEQFKQMMAEKSFADTYAPRLQEQIGLIAKGLKKEQIEKIDNQAIREMISDYDDEITRLIIKEFPDISPAKLNHMKGEIAERMMDAYLGQNWKKIEGEIGRNGIDGLYFKEDKDKGVVSVLICESKYGTSKLGDTQNGKQMSKEWILDRLDKLIKQYPDDKRYPQIREIVSRDMHKSRIFHMDVKNGNLSIEIKKIVSEGKEATITELQGAENYKINKIPPIAINNPEGKYQTNLVNTLNEITKDVIQEYRQKQSQNKE